MSRTGSEHFRLDGRVAIVTGASRGLGKSIAEGLARAGASLVLCSRRLPDLQAVGRSLRSAFGIDVQEIECDVTDSDHVDHLVSRAVERFGAIHIVVNNAGINLRGPIESLALADFQAVLTTNVTGPWLLCKAVAPLMKRAHFGRVINVASTLGLVGAPNRTPYAASKGALIQLTRSLAIEWAEAGITVNVICPGPFLTDMVRDIAQSQDFQHHILGAVPMKRCGELHEIQAAVVFLASNEASYVTGSVLSVDGGWVAQ